MSNLQSFMNNHPILTIKRSDRTLSGSLMTSTLKRIRESMLAYGFVLLPSDTCYSVAALAMDNRVQTNVNTLLNRPQSPISLSFPNLTKVEGSVYLNPVSSLLLERFTPGPITVICNSKPEVPVEITSQVVGSSDRTIGVRIPDSQIEREIASCTRYPITTVAVRDPVTNEAVRNFAQAMVIIQAGMARLNDVAWVAAIEGEQFYANHSTVVRVPADAGQPVLLREGDIPWEELEAAVNQATF
jgi:L-threonylcarbamoyladenylate synthase